MHSVTECSTITECLRRYGNDVRTCFVFPSRIASRLWLHRALEITGLHAVPAESFIAWDAFKADCCISSETGKFPASQVIRLLFAHRIAEENAAAATPLFHELIPADYAADGTVFVQWIAGILPQLDHWEKRTAQHCPNKAGETAEDKDLRFLKKAYTEFLALHRIFEPSWVGASFDPHGKRYILFYPELMEDFEEYRSLLDDRPEIAVLPAFRYNAETVRCTRFDTMRQEIRSTALAVEQLLTSGVPADEIALSVAGIEEAVPYLKRECALRSIPAEFRLGFKLGEQQAGRLFSLLETCVQEHYSFESLKQLLLNPHIPWKGRSHIKALINFGIKNNCLVSWIDKGKYKNVWLEAFKLPIPYNPHSSFEEEEAERLSAKEWLIPFMSAAEKLVHAKRFSDIQRQYIVFRDSYIEMNDYSAEDNAVISRCIATLQELTALEDAFSDCMPTRPYHFFTVQLSREIYVPQNTGRAVSIFPFRVAAATPFAHHFVLNCSQKASRVIYQKLPFLRKDKREALGVAEKDATQDFFAVYAGYGSTRFSYSEQTFSGFAVANSLLTAFEEPSGDETDSFLQEYAFFRGEQSIPAAFYPVQKNGFERFIGLLKRERGFSFLTEPFGSALPSLSALLHAERYEESAVRISQSDLSLFSFCAARWFLSSVLHISEEDTDAQLFNPRYTGIICHKVLEQLYRKIREVDAVFNAAHLSDYTAWAESLFDTLVHSQTDFRGPLAAPFIESIKKRSMKSIAFVLNFDAEKLDGYMPYGMEERIRWRDSEKAILYHGLIDRISYRAEEKRPVILDYKTGAVPPATAYAPESLSDFQIPMYLFLTETARFEKNKIEHAFFLDITKEKVSYIVNDKTVIPQGRSHAKTRDEFEPSIQAFLREAEHFADCVRNEDFTKQEAVQRHDCLSCPFRTICRTVFNVRE